MLKTDSASETVHTYSTWLLTKQKENSVTQPLVNGTTKFLKSDHLVFLNPHYRHYFFFL